MYLYGASGHAKVIIEMLENQNIPIEGLFDDNSQVRELLGYECAGYSKGISFNSEIIISIGDNNIRKRIVEKLIDEKFGVVTDLSSKISKRAVIGNGTVIMPGVSINSSSIIGEHNIINTNSSVDHDCIFGNFVHISPGSSIAGGVSIKEGTHVGIAACILPNISIGEWCVIGAGAVVNKDVPDYSVIVGNPGRIIRNFKNEK